jgi:hypothetical protein
MTPTACGIGQIVLDDPDWYHCRGAREESAT